jgi:hypothetical protein
MKKDFGSDSKSALEAKSAAAELAFAPMMFQASRALRDLGILEALVDHDEDGRSLDELVSASNVTPYGGSVLLDAGLSIGLVRMESERFFLTKTGYFWIRDPMTRVNTDFINDVCYRGMFHLREAIESGKPAGLQVFGDWPTIYKGVLNLPERVQESWFAFDHYYSDLVFPLALPIVFANKPASIMDIGGNTGKWALACTRHDADVKVTIVDLPKQIKIAMQNAQAAGVGDRVDGVVVDLLDASQELPKDRDLIWMSQFLDCFSKPEIVSILSRVREAMNAGSRVYILEAYWDRQKFSASSYSLNATSLYFTCLANGNSRMYHSKDMHQLIREAGLDVEQEHDNLGVSHTLTICRKP